MSGTILSASYALIFLIFTGTVRGIRRLGKCFLTVPIIDKAVEVQRGEVT